MYPAQVFTFFTLKTVLWTLSHTELQIACQNIRFSSLFVAQRTFRAEEITYSTTESTKCALYIAIISFSKKNNVKAALTF